MWVEVGYVARAHGVTGELRVVLHSADEGFPETIETLRLSKAGQAKNYQVQEVRPTKGAVLMRLYGCSTREAAAALKGWTLEVDEKHLPEVEGREHYLYEVMGASVESADGEKLGKIKSFLDNGAHPIAVLALEGKENLLPWVEAFFVSFDRETRVVVVDVPDGLWDDSSPVDTDGVGEG